VKQKKRATYRSEQVAEGGGRGDSLVAVVALIYTIWGFSLHRECIADLFAYQFVSESESTRRELADLQKELFSFGYNVPFWRRWQKAIIG
jgi:hypothetical protein